MFSPSAIVIAYILWSGPFARRDADAQPRVVSIAIGKMRACCGMHREAVNSGLSLDSPLVQFCCIGQPAVEGPLTRLGMP